MSLIDKKLIDNDIYPNYEVYDALKILERGKIEEEYTTDKFFVAGRIGALLLKKDEKLYEQEKKIKEYETKMENMERRITININKNL